MGKADAAQKLYMNKNDRVADAFNFILYDGAQVIKPESLRDLSTDEIVIPYGRDGKITAADYKERYRDILKILVYKEDDHNKYLILGIENQTDTHYAMPVKTLLYDAMQYAAQVNAAAAGHRAAKDGRGHGSGEFLSGFYKEDRLKPVITLTVLFNPGEWDGPFTLREMMETQDPEILKHIPDYSINLIQPAGLSGEDFEKFHTDLAAVMRFMKLSRDKDRMRDIMDKDPEVRKSYEHMNTDAAMVLNTCAKLKMKIDENEEVTDMCKAWDDMGEECRAEGRAEGIETGEKRIVVRMHEQGRSTQEISELTGIEAERIAVWTQEAEVFV